MGAKEKVEGGSGDGGGWWPVVGGWSQGVWLLEMTMVLGFGLDNKQGKEHVHS